MRSPPSTIKFAAFTIRLLRRSFGHPWYKFGENIEKRSAVYLTKLRGPLQSLKLSVALENLSHELDLVIEDYALSPNALALQLRIINLAETSEIAREIAIRMLNEPPVAKLFCAILKQAKAGEANSIAIVFSSVNKPLITVSYLVSGCWNEAMTIPASLDVPLRGIVRRAEQMSYKDLLKYSNDNDNLPENVTFNWRSETELEIAFSVTRA